tara:strand:+ start:211 stop:453 length:243 start_codon:yes stop_codon:yes gene_type:complete
MKTYEVGLKIDGELSVQTLEEKRLSAWSDPVDWKVAIDFAICLARELYPKTTIDFEYVKEFEGWNEPDVGYVHDCTMVLQ